jgi:hypothetical protein
VRNGEDPAQRPVENGHVFLLKSCQYWLGGLADIRDELRVTTLNEVIKDVLYHSPLVETTSGLAITDVLVDIDQKLSAQSGAKECWPFLELESTKICFPVGEKDRFTFMAFAIASSMHSYVKATFLHKESSTSIFRRRSGLPLLFFSILCPGHGSDAQERPKMVERLLKYGCDAKETVQGQRPGRTVDALSMYLFSTEGHDWSVITEPFMAVCRLLLPKGSNPNGRRCTGSESSLPMFTLNRGSFKYKGSWRRESHRPSRTYEWCPIIHDIGLLPVDHEHLSTLFNEFITSRVDLNAEDSKGTTLLELLFRKHVYLSLEGWLQLLENGAKVTRAMVEFRREENASDERSGPYSTKYDNHPLRHPQCREARFYHWRAKEIASQFNPEWNDGVGPGRWVRRVSDTFLASNALASAKDLLERKAEDFRAGSQG